MRLCNRVGISLLPLFTLVAYAGGSALPAIYPQLHLQPGGSTQWLLDDTKTGREDGPIYIGAGALVSRHSHTVLVNVTNILH
jgi:hypothetical protein